MTRSTTAKVEDIVEEAAALPPMSKFANVQSTDLTEMHFLF